MLLLFFLVSHTRVVCDVPRGTRYVASTWNVYRIHLEPTYNSQVLPQMDRQLLLLWQSNTNPKISAHAHVYGQHNYDAAPFVPIGMETLVHEKPHRQKSFTEHCKKGFVLVQALSSLDHVDVQADWQMHSKAIYPTTSVNLPSTN